MNVIFRYSICLMMLSIVGNASERFMVPPFDAQDLSGDSLLFSPDLSLSEMRTVMMRGDFPDQLEAANELIKSGDEKAVLRVIYALKQGEPAAERLLWDNSSLMMVPFLMEDVAHGSLDDYYVGILETPFGRVRLAATEIVARALAENPNFTDETQRWLQNLADGGGIAIFRFPEKSKVLVEWWEKNEELLIANKMHDVKPLLTWSGYPSELPDIHSPPDRPTPPPAPDEPKVPLEVSEPFEVWSKRIVNQGQRDLTFRELLWKGGSLIELPSKLAGTSPGSTTSPDLKPQFPTSSEEVIANSKSPQSGVSASSTQWIIIILTSVMISSLLLLLFVKNRKSKYRIPD